MKNNRLLLAWIIALGFIAFGVLANWYLVYVIAAQPVAVKETVNPYQEFYEDLLYPSVRIETENGIGSGVVITSTDKTTYIITAAHVVGDEASVKVTFYYYSPNSVNTTITASVVATDTLKDLALLKTYTYKPYPYVVKLAPRNYTPYIFTPVWVVGCSLGYSPRPTEGCITALCDLSASASPADRSVANYWEINAPIWPGNSGGGVFLKDTHELIGIAVWVRVCQWQLASTMGGIVPLQDIYKFLNENPDTVCRDLTRSNDPAKAGSNSE